MNPFLLSIVNLLGGHRDIFRIGARVELSGTSNVSDDTIPSSVLAATVNPKAIATIINYTICEPKANVLFDGSLHSNTVEICKLSVVNEIPFTNNIVLDEDLYQNIKLIMYSAIDEIENVEVPPDPLCPLCGPSVATAAQISEAIIRMFTVFILLLFLSPFSSSFSFFPLILNRISQLI